MGNSTLVDVETPGIRVVDGGDQSALLTPASSTSINVKGGGGFVANRDNIINGVAQSIYIRWPDFNNVDIAPLLPALTGNFPVVINMNAEIEILDSGGSSVPTASQFNNNIYIGVIATNNGTIINLQIGAFPTYGAANAVYTMLRAVGALNSAANPITVDPSATLGASFLRIQSNPGEALSPAGGYIINPVTPHTVVRENTTDPLPLVALALRDSSFTFSATGELDPDNYEDTATGALIAMPNNKYQLQHLFFFPQGGILAAVYGGAFFNTLQAAINSAVTGLPIISGLTSALPIANIAIRQGTTDFSNSSRFRFTDVI